MCSVCYSKFLSDEPASTLFPDPAQDYFTEDQCVNPGTGKRYVWFSHHHRDEKGVLSQHVIHVLPVSKKWRSNHFESKPIDVRLVREYAVRTGLARRELDKLTLCYNAAKGRHCRVAHCVYGHDTKLFECPHGRNCVFSPSKCRFKHDLEKEAKEREYEELVNFAKLTLEDEMLLLQQEEQQDDVLMYGGSEQR